MKLIDSKTYLNLAKSFAGECQAYVRYKFVEYGARYNKLENIAQIIDKIAYNEFNHARVLYTKIQSASKNTIENIEVCTGYPFKEKWDLTENMLLTADDEHEEAEAYTRYAETAREEGFEDIATLFEELAKIELQHEEIFKALHKELANDTLYKSKEKVLWVCDGCGYRSEAKEPWEKCPVCQAERQALHINFTL